METLTASSGRCRCPYRHLRRAVHPRSFHLSGVGVTVLERKTLHLLGVPCEAVEAFVRLLYTGEVEEGEVVRTYGMQLLVLAHAYRVGWVKSACEAALSEMVVAETVVDVMKLARLCDAPRLYVRCMKVVTKDFAAVERTEWWGWIQAHDPRLELEILQFLDDADMGQTFSDRVQIRH